MKTVQIEFVTTFSKFVSTRLIGEGGSGYVYEVKDDNGEKFAVKLLKKQSITTVQRKRFQNEIIFCQRSSHPNIISINDNGVLFDEGIAIPFYVMPLYDSSLRYLMGVGLKPEVINQLFSQLLDGAEAAHLKGIVHRDLKPENILYNTSENKLVLADFGIARFIEDELYTAVETKAQERLANFQYAAPEQRVRGRNVDNRADIYAIGLILNEMFTHEIPQGSGYKTISSIFPEYSYLDGIVEMMIRQNPDDRFPTIKGIKLELKARGVANISEQKLSKLKSVVILSSIVDDPLVVTPIEITGFEWEEGLLTLILSQPINPRWRNAFLNFGSYTSISGKGPDRFELKDNLAIIRAEERMVQGIIDHFKAWIPLITARYKQDLEDEIRLKENAERQKIKKKIEDEETRLRLRNNIKL